MVHTVTGACNVTLVRHCTNTLQYITVTYTVIIYFKASIKPDT